MNLYLLKFYSYQDRKLWFTDSLASYRAAGFSYKAIDVGVSFKMNDGISTEQVTNYNPEGYNYLICEIDGVIKSRWYILKATKLRTNQYNLQLKRDVLADYYDNYKNLEVSIDRCFINNINDVNIFNSESISCNKIKSEEREIKDETQIPWVVGYIPRDFAKTETKRISIQTGYTTTEGYQSFSSWSEYPLYNEIGKKLLVGELNLNLYIAHQDLSSTTIKIQHPLLEDGTDVIYNTFKIKDSTLVYKKEFDSTSIVPHCTQFTKDLVNSTLINNLGYQILTKNILQEQNKIYYIKQDDGTYKMFRMKVTQTLNPTLDKTKILSYLAQKVYIDSNYFYGQVGNNSYDLSGNIAELILEAEEVESNEWTAAIDNTRSHLKDQPYDMFCLPYADISIDGYTFTKANSMNMAQAIATELGDAAIYDIQLLPFCPCRKLINFDTSTGVANRYYLTEKGTNYSTITDKAGTAVSLLFWCNSSNFTFTIPCNLTVSNTTTKLETDPINTDFIDIPTDSLEFKSKNIYQSMRFCAPDYSNFFEFNPRMNNGMSLINVECTYMPYSPYIRIYPKFNYLYGKSFNDNRGLVLKGDYSIPRLSSSWANYKLQNKNYQNTFNLETYYLNRQNNLSLLGDSIGAITGSLGAGVTGASMSKALGTGGLGIGVGTGLTSLAGGIADVAINNQTRQLQMQQRQKQFEYNIENIKAIPYGLSSSGSFNLNRKMFPYIELYTATTQEQALVEKFITLNGMSYKGVDKVINYHDWLQASLITNSKLESTIRDDINAELKQGIYKLI
jgi:hypothetical protein